MYKYKFKLFILPSALSYELGCFVFFVEKETDLILKIKDQLQLGICHPLPDHHFHQRR